MGAGLCDVATEDPTVIDLRAEFQSPPPFPAIGLRSRVGRFGGASAWAG